MIADTTKIEYDLYGEPFEPTEDDAVQEHLTEVLCRALLDDPDMTESEAINHLPQCEAYR